MRKLWIFLGISSFLCDFSTCSLAMGLGSRLSPWNLGLSSSQAATCNSSTQQRHASARFEPQKNIPSVENLEGYWNSWETHHVTYPTNQPTNNIITSLRPRRPNKGRSPATWGLCDPRNAEWSSHQRQAAQALDQRRVGSVLLGETKLFCLELTGASLLRCKPKFWLTLISSGCSENSGPGFSIGVPMRSLCQLSWKSWSTGLHFLSTFSEMDRWAIWLP